MTTVSVGFEIPPGNSENGSGSLTAQPEPRYLQGLMEVPPNRLRSTRMSRFFAFLFVVALFVGCAPAEKPPVAEPPKADAPTTEGTPADPAATPAAEPEKHE